MILIDAVADRVLNRGRTHGAADCGRTPGSSPLSQQLVHS
eukprot:CAMPEP_0115356996 /NCGR_PEP_ID=MMETSP0270-20121206/99907_1 /TAXON_ID=71861 /ORGANISM="Scrippsiella trochoidea, Strain CCMP3099" /LENGTH=39 /DNA_ID= /DNA_START= /DNA_END= /DNA_ORIENTATION=